MARTGFAVSRSRNGRAGSRAVRPRDGGPAAIRGRPQMTDPDLDTPDLDLGARMAAELREAPEAVARQAAILAAPVAELAAAPAAAPAAGRGHLRARQLGPRCDLRQAPDRAQPRRSGRRGRPEHRDHLPPAAASSRTSCSSRSRSRAAATTSSSTRRGPGAAGALTVALLNVADSPLGARVRDRAADGRRTGAQRRGDQDLHRLAGGAAAAHGGVGRRRVRWKRRSTVCRSAWPRPPSSTGARRCRALAEAGSLMTIGAGRRSRSRARRRSS